MRTEEHRIDARANQRTGFVHLVVDGVEHGHVEQAARHTGLIGRHHHAIVGLIEPRDGLQTARYRLPFRRAFDELVGIEIDHAVTIEDDEFHKSRPC